jgi:hypothetical protein
MIEVDGKEPEPEAEADGDGDGDGNAELTAQSIGVLGTTIQSVSHRPIPTRFVQGSFVHDDPASLAWVFSWNGWSRSPTFEGAHAQ